MPMSCQAAMDCGDDYRKRSTLVLNPLLHCCYLNSRWLVPISRPLTLAQLSLRKKIKSFPERSVKMLYLRYVVPMSCQAAMDCGDDYRKSG